jgi:predicted PurR-regulated permease PerM
MRTSPAGTLKTASICLIISLLLTACYLGREIIFPILMAMLFAVLLRPMVNFMNTRLRFPHIIAVALSIAIGLGAALGIVWFLSYQIGGFVDDLPLIKKNVNHHILNLQHWLEDSFNWKIQDQNKSLTDMQRENKLISGDRMSSLVGPLLNGVLIPIYTFLILIYRALFLRFLTMVTPANHHETLADIVIEVKSVVRSYIVGLITEMGIVAAMTALGFWIVGVEYYIFLGLLTGILNLIPYVGIMVALAISVLMAMVSSTDITPIIGVLIVNGVVQFIDNNILMPRIVGSKVSINALASIVAVIIGGHVAGVAGMFLAIPIVAIMKVVFDRIEGTKPVGFLMGDTIPKTFNWRSIRFPDLNAGGEVPQGRQDNSENREIL